MGCVGLREGVQVWLEVQESGRLQKPAGLASPSSEFGVLMGAEVFDCCFCLPVQLRISAASVMSHGLSWGCVQALSALAASDVRRKGSKTTTPLGMVRPLLWKLVRKEQRLTQAA